MLTVYLHKVERPEQALDLSLTPLEDLDEAALAFYSHQTSGSVWFGYLEGWMLTPQQEARLRPVLRKFDCSLVSAFPLSLSHAWQNEINTIYTANPNGLPNSHNNGRPLHDGSEARHGHSRPDPAPNTRSNQDRKARRPPKGRVEA
jgi:hypothetical protein